MLWWKSNNSSGCACWLCIPSVTFLEVSSYPTSTLMGRACCLETGDIQFIETVPDALVVSSAVPEGNAEILFAKEAGAPRRKFGLGVWCLL